MWSSTTSWAPTSSYTWDLKIEDNEGEVDEAFADAAHVVKERYVQQRLIPMAMEPRAVAAVPQPFGGDMTLYSGTQVPHILKIMTAITLGIPEHQMRVIAPAVGGGFGSKLNVYAEELLCVALARKHKVPVRWNEERTENAVATIHGRGQIQHIELAADETASSLRCACASSPTWAPTCSSSRPAFRCSAPSCTRGCTTSRVYDFSCTSVFTTLTPTDAYRGAGRPEATYAIERAMDTLARQMGIDPMELRKRNFIRRSSSRTRRSPAWCTTRGDHLAAAEKAAGLADYDGVRARQATQNVPGATKLLGIGQASYFEMCGLAPSRVLASLNYSAGGWEAATVRVLPTNKIQVVTGTAPHGQGHETSWSMIVADKLGVSPDDVDVLHSDTAIAPLGLDTYGSRSLPVGGVAIAMACDKVIDKAKKIAAHQLEANEDDLEFAGGTFTREGLPRPDDAARGHRVRGVHRPQPARRARAQPRGAGHLRPAELLVAVRHAHLHRRGRHRDRRGRRAAVRGRRRLRQPGQPAHRRRAGARRRHPGPRPGAVRGSRATTRTAT